VTALSAFEVTTEQDKNKIEEVSTRTTVLLPSNDKLNADLRQKMDAATRSMQHALEKVVSNEQKAKDNSGVKLYYFIAWPITLGTALYHSSEKKDAVAAMKAADTEYKSVLESAGTQMSAILGLRANCKNLQAMIANAKEAIQKAQGALTHMRNAFSRIQTDIEYITKRLGKIDDTIIDPDEYERNKSLQDFGNARWRWVMVKNLARGFQEKGILIEASLQQQDPSTKGEDQLEIWAATFGGDTVTNAAKVLFNDGDDLLVDSTSMPFVDGMKGVPKTVTMLYTYGEEKRLFVCVERSGEHKLKCGAISLSQDSTSLQAIITPRPKPSGALYQILAIVYGQQEVKEDSSYNYVYQQMNSRKSVRWSNENFPDGWVGTRKSGAVYYTTDGNDTKVLAGKEFEETPW